MTTGESRAVLRWAGVTDVGKVRTNNEDQYMLRPEAQLWVVADGMGGHRGGEVASDLACKEMARSYREHTSKGLRKAVAKANRTVYEAGMADPELRGMGTTLVALAMVEDATQQEMLAIANVGDSRAYRLTHGRLEQLTADHSLVADLVREGSLSPDEAETHPQKNILTRVLGVNDDVEADVSLEVPQTGDRYLLCSDGLFNEVSEGQIETVLQRVEDPNEAAGELLHLALSGSARDNATIVIVDVVDDGSHYDPLGPAASATSPGAPGSDHAVTRTAETRPAGLYPPPGENGNDLPEASLGGGTAGAVGAATATVPASVGEDTAEYMPIAEPGASGDEHLPEVDEAPRRRPRRITWRVVLFILLLLALFGGVIGAIQWYGTRGYWVAFEDDQAVIYEGRPEGLLWISPELVQETELAQSDISAVDPAAALDMETGKMFPSLAEAREFTARLEDDIERMRTEEAAREDRQEQQDQQADSTGPEEPGGLDGGGAEP